MITVESIKADLAAQGRQGLALDIDETLSWTVYDWMLKLEGKFGKPDNLTPQERIARYQYIEHVPGWRDSHHWPEIIKWMVETAHSNEAQLDLPLIENAHEKVWQIHEHLPIVLYLTIRPAVY